MRPIVSIIMPAFNCEKYVGSAIGSAVKQSFRDWELIIIDDGSVDRTGEIINEMARNEPRIKAIANVKNIGVAATRNKGVEAASGEWIAFLDCDDLWRADKLECQLELADKEKADFIFSGASYVDADGKPFPGTPQIPERVEYKSLRRHNIIPCSSVLIKRKHLENIKMKTGDIHEDFATWLGLLQTGIIAYGVNEALVTYRISKDSRSGMKIHTFKKTYGAFRATGMGIIKSSWFTMSHVLLALRKYKRIYSG